MRASGYVPCFRLSGMECRRGCDAAMWSLLGSVHRVNLLPTDGHQEPEGNVEFIKHAELSSLERARFSVKLVKHHYASETRSWNGA